MYICIYRPIDIMFRVGIGRTRTQKCYLIPPCLTLSNVRYG